MNTKLLVFTSILVGGLTTGVIAQTKFGDNKASINAASLLELESTSKGLLLPRLTTVQRTAMGVVPEGMVIFNTTDSCINQYNRGKWNSLCESSFCNVVMVNDADNATFTYTDPNSAGGIFSPNEPQNSCALYISEDGGTWIWNPTSSSYVSKNDVYVEPWWNMANRQASRSLTDHIYHLGSSNVGTGYAPGKYSMTIGVGDTVRGNHSLVVGLNNVDSSHYSVVTGQANQIGNRGTGSLIFGTENVFTGTGNYDRSVIGGYNNRINKASSDGVLTLVARNSTLTGTTQYSQIFGLGDTVHNASGSAVFGYYNKDSANYNLVTGLRNIARSNSHNAAIFGENNVNNSTHTIVTGYGNTVGTGHRGNIIYGENNLVGNTTGREGALIGGSSSVYVGDIGPGIYSNDNSLDSASYGGVHALTAGASRNSFNSVLVGLNDTIVNSQNSIAVGTNLKLINAPNSAVFGGNNKDSTSFTLMAGDSNSISTKGEYSAVVGLKNRIYATPMSISNRTLAVGNFVSGYGNIIESTAPDNNGAGRSTSYAFLTGYENKIYGTTDATGTTGSASDQAIVGGRFNTLYGSTRTVLYGGWNTVFNSNYNLVTGSQNIVNKNSHNSAVFGGGGDNNATPSGLGNKLTGAGSLVSGRSNDVVGSYTTVFGRNNSIVSPTLTAITYGGYNVVGGGGTSIDSGNVVVGEFSAVFGNDNKDTANYALMAGQGNKITSTMNHATVIGKFNTPVSNALFTIGNGTGRSNSERSNLFVVTNNNTTGAATQGKIIYSAQLPIYNSESSAVSDTSLPDGAFFRVGTSRVVYQK